MLIAIGHELAKLDCINDAVDLWCSVLINSDRSLYGRLRAAGLIKKYKPQIKPEVIHALKELSMSEVLHYRIRDKIVLILDKYFEWRI